MFRFLTVKKLIEMMVEGLIILKHRFVSCITQRCAVAAHRQTFYCFVLDCLDSTPILSYLIEENLLQDLN